MNLHAMLLEREAAGRPVTVGLIGAGKFGSMYLAQVPRTQRRAAVVARRCRTTQSAMRGSPPPGGDARINAPGPDRPQFSYFSSGPA